jgi:hypothetical protein
MLCLCAHIRPEAFCVEGLMMTHSNLKLTLEGLCFGMGWSCGKILLKQHESGIGSSVDVIQFTRMHIFPELRFPRFEYVMLEEKWTTLDDGSLLFLPYLDSRVDFKAVHVEIPCPRLKANLCFLKNCFGKDISFKWINPYNTWLSQSYPIEVIIPFGQMRCIDIQEKRAMILNEFLLPEATNLILEYDPLYSMWRYMLVHEPIITKRDLLYLK